MLCQKMKRKTIISISAYFLYTILCVLLVYTRSSSGVFGKDMDFIITYILTLPLVPSLLSIYDLTESIIKKSYKNIMTWICGLVGFLIAFLYLGAFLDFILIKSFILYFMLIGGALILLCRIGKIIKYLFDKIRERREYAKLKA